MLQLLRGHRCGLSQIVGGEAGDKDKLPHFGACLRGAGDGGHIHVRTAGQMGAPFAWVF